MAAISPVGPKMMEQQPTDRRLNIGHRCPGPRELEQRRAVAPGPRLRWARGGPRQPVRRAELHGAAQIPRGPSSHVSGRRLPPRMRRGGGDCRDRLRVRHHRRQLPSRQHGPGADPLSLSPATTASASSPSPRARSPGPPPLSSPCPPPVQWSTAARSPRLRGSRERSLSPRGPGETSAAVLPAFAGTRRKNAGPRKTPDRSRSPWPRATTPPTRRAHDGDAAGQNSPASSRQTAAEKAGSTGSH